MTVEEGLYAYLAAHAGLSALIGTRLYPVTLPQTPTLPAVIYQRVSGPEVYSHQGFSNLVTPRFQFDCRGLTYASAKAVAAQVKAALRGYKGLMGTVSVNGARIENDLDASDPELGHYSVLIDAVIPHTEA